MTELSSLLTPSEKIILDIFAIFVFIAFILLPFIYFILKAFKINDNHFVKLFDKIFDFLLSCYAKSFYETNNKPKKKSVDILANSRLHIPKTLSNISSKQSQQPYNIIKESKSTSIKLLLIIVILVIAFYVMLQNDTFSRDLSSAFSAMFKTK